MLNRIQAPSPNTVADLSVKIGKYIGHGILYATTKSFYGLHLVIGMVHEQLYKATEYVNPRPKEDQKIDDSREATCPPNEININESPEVSQTDIVEEETCPESVRTDQQDSQLSIDISDKEISDACIEAVQETESEMQDIMDSIEDQMIRDPKTKKVNLVN